MEYNEINKEMDFEAKCKLGLLLQTLENSIQEVSRIPNSCPSYQKIKEFGSYLKEIREKIYNHLGTAALCEEKLMDDYWSVKSEWRRITLQRTKCCGMVNDVATYNLFLSKEEVKKTYVETIERRNNI